MASIFTLKKKASHKMQEAFLIEFKEFI